MELFTKRYKQELEILAYYDRITGLPNRDKFEAFFDSRPQFGEGYAYVVIRAEEYRRVRENLGRDPADGLLRSVADLLYDLLNEGEAAARIGGGDFALLVKAASPQILEQRLQMIAKKLQQIHVVCAVADKQIDFNYQLTYRAGALLLGGKKEQNAEVVEGMARIAAQVARSRNVGYAIFDQTNPAYSVAGVAALEPDIDRALDQQEFITYIQPEYCFETGRIAGAEMLVRWNHPEAGIIMPKEFMAMLEFNGRIFKVDMLVLEYACQMLQDWMKKELMPVPLSINVSRLTLYRSDFVERVLEIVRQYAVPEILIAFEINESVVFDAPLLVQGVIARLREAGFRVLLDNFGMGGFSSLHHIGTLNINGIKPTWNFFRNGMLPEREQIVLKHILIMAKELKMSVVFSNVETIEQAELIQRMGGRYVQGFLFEKPFPQEEFEGLVFGPQSHADLLRSIVTGIPMDPIVETTSEATMSGIAQSEPVVPETVAPETEALETDPEAEPSPEDALLEGELMEDLPEKSSEI